MGRETRKRRQPPRVLREIQSRPSDVALEQGPTGIPSGAAPIGRLQFLWQTWPFDAVAVADSIDFSPGGAVFCDSTVFIAPTDKRIWGALLRQRRVTLIPPILEELKWWLDDPRGVNVVAHEQIKTSQAAIADGRIGPIRIIEELPNEQLTTAALYYISLLGVRKQMFGVARQRLEREIGRTASKQEVSNYIQREASSRAQLLARQGEEGTITAHLHNDERLVVTAIMYAITTGQEVTIISSDEAVLDQFEKAIWLIDTHYRSMLMAALYAKDPFIFPTARAKNPHKKAFTDDELLLLRLPSKALREVLPPNPEGVQIHCVLLQKDVTRVTFQAEVEMRHVLYTKGRTGGLSTDKFDGRNCHICLGDAMKFGNWATIGLDLALESNEGRIKLAVVDLGLALLPPTHRTEIVTIDPRLLLIPTTEQVRQLGHSN